LDEYRYRIGIRDELGDMMMYLPFLKRRINQIKSQNEMKPIQISINPLAEFSEASDRRKERIRIEALDPNQFKIALYQSSRLKVH